MSTTQLNEYKNDDLSYACEWRADDTATGSFRSHSYGWHGDTAIMAAIEYIFNNPGKQISVHVCEHPTKGNQTVYALTCWYVNEGGVPSVRFCTNRHCGESRLSDGNPIHAGVKLSMYLMNYADREHSIYLQPTQDQASELNSRV